MHCHRLIAALTRAATALVVLIVLFASTRAFSGKPVGPTDPAIAYEQVGKLAVMDADGSNQKILLGGKGANAPISRDPNWSPDGSKIVFASNVNGNGVYIINKDGTGLCKVVDTDPTPDRRLHLHPAWSPKSLGDGKYKIVYSNVGDLYMVDAGCGTGSTKRQLTATTALREGFVTWSADGNRIAAMVSDASDSPASHDVLIYTLSVDASGTVTVGDPASLKARMAVSNPRGPAWAHTAVNSNLLAITSCDLLQGCPAWDITVVDTSTYASANITQSANFDEIEPSWSPDDSELVIVGSDSGIYKIRSNGSAYPDGRVRILLAGPTGDLDIYPDWRRCDRVLNNGIPNCAGTDPSKP